MFTVNQVYDEAKKIIGACSDDRLFQWLGDGVSLIANKGEFEGWKGYLDICTSGCCVTLPREVDTVLGVNIAGRPSLGLDLLFNFHLNGPGDIPKASNLSWQDKGGWHAVYRDLVTPSKLVAYLSTANDNGAELIVYGYDSNGHPLRHRKEGVWLNGYQVPTVYGVAVPEVGAPEVARITAVSKAVTQGPVRLATIDSSGTTGTNLAVYEPDETLPQYRRIQLNRKTSWARIAYRKNNPVFNSRYDHVPLRVRFSLLLALKALKAYSEADLALAHSFEADAARLEIEAQNAAEPPVFAPVQVVNHEAALNDKSDYDIR